MQSVGVRTSIDCFKSMGRLDAAVAAEAYPRRLACCDRMAAPMRLLQTRRDMFTTRANVDFRAEEEREMSRRIVNNAVTQPHIRLQPLIPPMQQNFLNHA